MMIMKGKTDQKIISCAVVGDGMVGKTTLALSFVQKQFHDSGYVATVFDNYAGNVQLHGESYTVNIFDSPGQHDYEEVRAFSYKDSEVIIVCYSVTDRDTFRNVKDVWIPEAKSHMKRRKPLILIGCQTDLRDENNGEDVVSEQDGAELAKQVSADCFLECSSSSRTGVAHVFQQAIALALKNRKRKTSLINKILRR